MASALVVTRKDVAELAKVSPTTVSLVLNNRPGTRIPDTTRRRVREAARRLGYKPNATARALVSGKTRRVGAVMNLTGNPFRPHYATGIMEAFWNRVRARDYRLLVEQGRADSLLGGLYDQKEVDGILLMTPNSAADAELVGMIESGFPCVTVGGRPDTPNQPDHVDMDNLGVGRLLVPPLIEAGHRDFVLLAGPVNHLSAARERHRGVCEVLREAGVAITDDRVFEGDFTGSTGRAGMEAFLRRGLKFTAVITGNDAMAFGAAEALRASGLRIPDDVSIVGVDGREGPFGGLRLASVHQPVEMIGDLAAEMIFARLDGDDAPARIRLLPGIFAAGDTIAPPPRG